MEKLIYDSAQEIGLEATFFLANADHSNHHVQLGADERFREPSAMLGTLADHFHQISDLERNSGYKSKSATSNATSLGLK